MMWDFQSFITVLCLEFVVDLATVLQHPLLLNPKYAMAFICPSLYAFEFIIPKPLISS